jgi:hypothetical protein
MNARITEFRLRVNSWLTHAPNPTAPLHTSNHHSGSTSKWTVRNLVRCLFCRNGHTFKLTEVILIISIMTAIAFFLPVYFNQCTPLPVDMEDCK